MVRELIHCMDCHQVIPNYGGFELAPLRSLQEVEWDNADLVRVKEFLKAHRSHRMEKLLTEPASAISEQPFYEPLRVTHFLAGSRERKLLIRRSKTALGQPAFYEVIPGRLQVLNAALQIQEEDLAKQMAADGGLSLISRDKVQRFIKVFGKEVTRFSPETLGEAVESIEEGENSLQAFGSLKESVWERILDRCCQDWNAWERDQIRRFIAENQDPPQALSLLIQRRISILSLVERETPLALEGQKESAAVTQAQFISRGKKKVTKGRF